MRAPLVTALSVALLAGLFSCGDDSGNPVKPPASTATKKVIQMKDNFFDPATVAISEGDTIVWVNVGNNNHTSTSGPGCSGGGQLWDSGNVPPGQSFTKLFDSSVIGGNTSLPFYCTVALHCSGANMKGTITITP